MSALGFFAKQSLKAKIMSGMLMAGLVPLLIAAAVINWRSGVALEEQAVRQVESLAMGKKHEVEAYFHQIDNNIKFMSSDLMIVKAMDAFRESFSYLSMGDTDIPADTKQLKAFYRDQFGEKFKTETGNAIDTESLIPSDPSGITAQALYIAKNPHELGHKAELNRADDISAYSDDHDRFHPVLREFLETFGFYDVFLIEPENGTIVYSVFKELDFGTSLKSGPYANSTLAAAFNEAVTLKKGETVLEEFDFYLPSYNAPASFIAAPIYQHGKLLGVLAFQMPLDAINEIMQQAAGLGESGETFLFGSDGLMRSQSRLTEEPTLLKREVNQGALKIFETGEKRTGLFTNHAGTQVMGTYLGIDIHGLDWAIGAEIDEAEVFAPVTELQLINFGLVALTALLVSVGSWLFVTRISGRIRGAVTVANAIASGRFDNRIDASEGDEIQSLYRAMHRMQTELFGQMREKEISMSRIKAALDSADANMMVADEDNIIIYMNGALKKTLSEVESEFRSVLPKFSVDNLIGNSIDDFHVRPEHQKNLLAGLEGAHRAEIKVGRCVLSLTMNPILDTHGQRLGTVVEWRSLTKERAAEKSLERIITGVRDGVLSQRLDLAQFEGSYSILAQGLNQTLDAIESPIKETRRVMAALADGDLTQSFDGNFLGEFKQLGDAVNSSTSRLAEMITQLTGSVGSLTELSHHLSRGNVDLHDRTTSQAGSLQETAAAMEEITGTVEHNTENARHANQLSDQAVVQAEEGNRVVNSAIESIRQVNDSSEEIASITDLINEIAFQTNLLALNAAVEAARAGEQGRGFAVVASEVRALAGRSADAAKQIETLIKESISKVSRGTDQVNRTGEALQNIVVSITKVSAIVSEISAASEEQSMGIGEINRAITQLESVTQNNLDLVGEISSVSDSLGTNCSEITDAIAVFKVESGESRRMSPDSRQFSQVEYEEFA